MAAQPNVVHVSVEQGVVRVLQLTDTHLCGTAGGTLLGMNTDHSLQAVLDLARTEHPDADIVLGTGDLADNGAPQAYARLHTYFAQFPCASFWLPGNHDNREAMVASGDQSPLAREIRAGAWQILLLDSQIPGQVGGRLGAAELAHLEAGLRAAERDGLYTLVVMHHHPVPIGCAWLDEQIVADAADLFAVLDRHSGARAVLWGHVHQEIDRMRGDVRLLATPSTCVQFAPGSDTFAAEATAPGYRWLELHDDGGIVTAVSRVQGVDFVVDLDSGGYL